jgi:hypothetical protein
MNQSVFWGTFAIELSLSRDGMNAVIKTQGVTQQNHKTTLDNRTGKSPTVEYFGSSENVYSIAQTDDERQYWFL